MINSLLYNSETTFKNNKKTLNTNLNLKNKLKPKYTIVISF